MPDDFVASADYHQVAMRLCLKLLALLQTAKQRGLAPPFELNVTGADDDAIYNCQCGYDAHLVPTPELVKLNVRWPITATLTDSKGEVLLFTITPDSAVQ